MGSPAGKRGKAKKGAGLIVFRAARDSEAALAKVQDDILFESPLRLQLLDLLSNEDMCRGGRRVFLRYVQRQRSSGCSWME